MVHIRQFAWADYGAVAAVWTAAGRDVLPRTELHAKLRRDPQLFLVADAGQAIVGVVLGTFDGRRGWIRRITAPTAS